MIKCPKKKLKPILEPSMKKRLPKKEWDELKQHYIDLYINKINEKKIID